MATHRMRGLRDLPPVRARVVGVAVRHLSDGVPYVEIKFKHDGGDIHGRYWLTPGAVDRTVRGLAAVGVTLGLDEHDNWTHAIEPIYFDLPLVEVECNEDETHGKTGVMRTFVAAPARAPRVAMDADMEEG